jgi:ribulose-phosphate 3-epimerase
MECQFWKPLTAKKKTIDVHLMIVDPDRYKTFAELGANILSVHYEMHASSQNATSHQSRRNESWVAINPHTNIDLLEDVINDVDLVCIMSVNPGFGGQSFIKNIRES